MPYRLNGLQLSSKRFNFAISRYRDHIMIYWNGFWYEFADCWWESIIEWIVKQDATWLKFDIYHSRTSAKPVQTFSWAFIVLAIHSCLFPLTCSHRTRTGA